MKPGDISGKVPHVRPHNQVRDRKIFFMISRRPLLELSAEELSLYQNIDGQKTVADLEKMSPGAGDVLVKWRQAGIIELIAPVPRLSRPHLVVVEPHMDDAVLSAGGRLLRRRGRWRITLLSVVKWSNFTTYLLLNRNLCNVRDVTAVRQAESALVAKCLGAEHHCLDWNDAPIRFWPTEHWSPKAVEKFNATPQAFVKLFPDPKEVSLMAEQLLECLCALAPDELWIPMGLGDHVDHRTTRGACLLALTEGRERFSDVPVSMYEDLPYAATVGHAAQVGAALAGGGTRVVRTTEDITDVFEEKLRLASIYASQFKLSYMEPTLRKFAEREGGGAGKLAEAYHRLEGQPCSPNEYDFSREREGLVALRQNQSALRRTNCRELTIVALPSGWLGRWNIVRESLRATFPNADLRVYVSEDAAWQAEAVGNDRFRVAIVTGGRMEWVGWLGVAFRELFRFRTPTVVLWRGAYASDPMRMPKVLINMLIKSLLPFRPVLFARTLWDFCSVSNEVARELDTTRRLEVSESRPFYVARDLRTASVPTVGIDVDSDHGFKSRHTLNDS